MAMHIYFCKDCKRYTMKEVCPVCNGPAHTSRPPKYSPDDKYAEMKRKAKAEEYREKGYI